MTAPVGTKSQTIEEGDAENMNPEEEAETSELVERSARQELAEFASSLMMAAAARNDGEAEENDEAKRTPTKPLVKKAHKLLFRRLRIGVEDSRVFIGDFHCLDKQGNIILYDTVEYRPISPPPPSGGDGGNSSGASGAVDATDGATMEQRSLGFVLIPARCRTSCHVECSLQEQFSLLSV